MNANDEVRKAPIILPGLMLIEAERRRQIESEGWTPEHDDGHSCAEMVAAAICYAAYATGEPVFRKVVNDHAGMMAFSFVDPWPWDEAWDKRDVYVAVDPNNDGILPTEEQIAAHKLRCLVKAGALIAADIDRVLRASDEPATPAPPSEATDILNQQGQVAVKMGGDCDFSEPPPASAGGELPDEPGMWSKPQWGSVLVMRDEDRPVAQVWDDRAGSLAGSRMAIELLPRGNWRKSAAAAGEVERLRDELSTSEAAATAEAIFADELNAKLTQAHARIAALEVSAKELMRQLDSANRRYDNQRDKATHFQLKVAALEARVRELTPDPPAHAYDPSVIRS